MKQSDDYIYTQNLPELKISRKKKKKHTFVRQFTKSLYIIFIYASYKL